MKKNSILVGAVLAGALFTTSAVSAKGALSFGNLGSGSEVRSNLLNGDNADSKTNDAKCGDKTKGADAKCGDKKGKDAKCGEGKCGDKKGKDHKCGEGKCGDKKAKDHKCGEGKCGDKKHDHKKEEAKPATPAKPATK